MEKMYVAIVFFLLLTTSVLLVACGSSSSSSTSPSSTASLSMKGTSGNAVNMNGTWKNCVHDAANQSDDLSEQTFSGGSASIKNSSWHATTTANCLETTTPDVTFVGTAVATLGAEATATWTDGNGSTTPPIGISANAEATKVTPVFNSATLTLGSATAVSQFNSTAFCGKTDWAIGVAKNVLNCSQLNIPTTDYWVVDDSAAVLKWYSQSFGTSPYQVDSINPMLK